MRSMQIYPIIIMITGLAFSVLGSSGYLTRTKRMQYDISDDEKIANQETISSPHCNPSTRSKQNDSVKKTRPNSAKQLGLGIAVNAAQEAKKANDDMPMAVKTASRKIKMEFAEKASQAAKAAEAVLAAKRQVMEQLEIEVREAETVVQEEAQALCTADNTSQLAQKAAAQAKMELKMLINVLKMARENFDTAEQVSTLFQQSMQEKTSLLEAAQNRVGELLRQLAAAKTDFEKTKKSARTAVCAAKEAQDRVNRQ